MSAKNAPETFGDITYYHHLLQPVNDYHGIDDILFKFSLNLPDEQIPLVIVSTARISGWHHEARHQRLRFLSTFLIIRDCIKRMASVCLLKRWNGSPTECRRHWRQR